MGDIPVINIYLNGEVVSISKNQSLVELLKEQGYIDNGYAVALNRQFVPHGLHEKTFLQENDEIDIIEPMQGG
jgi:sulfur carrier protein